MTNLMPYGIAWAVLALVVIIFAYRRNAVASKEDDSLHLSGGETVVAEQVNLAKKLAAIDRWGKILTVVLVVSGLVLAVLYGMQVWEATSRAGLE